MNFNPGMDQQMMGMGMGGMGNGMDQMMGGGVNPMMGGGMNTMMGGGMNTMMGGGVNPMMGGGMNTMMGGGVNPMMGAGVNPMMGVGVNPMMGVGVNPMMGVGVNPMMGGMIPGVMPGFGGQNPAANMSIEETGGWTLIFENQNDRKAITIRINEQKLVSEAISLYKVKSGRIDKCKFIFNNKELFPEMKICQTGLQNLSKILVVSIQNVIGAI